MIKLERGKYRPGGTDAESADKYKPEAEKPAKRQFSPLQSIDGSRNYRAMYREACNFHERHNPPRLDDDGGAAYWMETAEDMGLTASSFGSDPFIVGLLSVIYEELEREYKAITTNGEQPERMKNQ